MGLKPNVSIFLRKGGSRKKPPHVSMCDDDVANYDSWLYTPECNPLSEPNLV